MSRFLSHLSRTVWIMSEFLKFDMGQCQRGDVVEVTLTKGANVRLLDSNNMRKYQRGESHRGQMGLAKRSPVRLGIKNSGHYYVVVDMQGLRGTTRASARKIAGSSLRPLPPLREARPAIAEIARALVDDSMVDREFDVFISHATEDKEDVVRPLAHALQSLGLVVWYDEFELRIGDSLRRKIDQGIARSRFGVVVLSGPFFAKSWPQYELDGLVTRSVSGQQILLPLWHDISKDEVMRQSPSLADKVAMRTSDYTIAEIAAEIAAVVTGTDDDLDELEG